jgi:PAS domain S-box-containing protein
MATILVVDDLSANRNVLVTLLRGLGHRMIEAADGRAGLDAVFAERPDLVITDVLMPVMDGYELLNQIRRDPATRSLPVVFYTAHYGEQEARAHALSSGVSDVLTKPVDSAEVLKVVGRALSREGPLDAPPVVAGFERQHLRLLTDQLSETDNDLRTANARSRALINIGLELASERSPDRLLEYVCVAARELFEATYATLGILNRDDGTLQRFITHGMDDPGHWISVGDAASGILRTVVDERRPLRGESPGGDPAGLQLPFVHPEVQAFLAAPIASLSRVYGWICLVRNEGRAFTENDEHLTMALTGLLGRVYENGYFFSIAEKRAAQLEQQIAEREQAEAAHAQSDLALQAAEERVRFALEAADVGIWDMDPATGTVRWSETLERQYGLRPGTFGGTYDAFVEQIHPDDRASVIETVGNAVKLGTDFSVVNRAIWPDGTVRWLSGAGRFLLGEHGEPLRGVGISQDITARRALEGQSLQAQKMEAIGQLASGVAHDFNNLLTVILGFTEFMAADASLGEEHGRDLSEIIKAATQAAGLTRQLLAFGRQQVLHDAPLDVNGLIRDMTDMLGRLIGEHINVTLALAPEISSVLADRGQIEQVVMNLVVNARDAMPGGGSVTIETRAVELDNSAFHEEPVVPGAYVMLAVTDTGTGMTRETQRRLFEPFFTTKGVGKGTGLGLSTTYGIVKQSKGHIWVYSEQGHGTTFKVYLPCSNVDVATPGATPAIVTAVSKAASETVLLVEDEAGVRHLSKRILDNAGYRVLEAANGNDAERLFANQATPIDLVVTDVIMPGCGGPELLQRLHVHSPALKVLYMSGYTERSGGHGLADGLPYVQKPFTASDFLQHVRNALEPQKP